MGFNGALLCLKAAYNFGVSAAHGSIYSHKRPPHGYWSRPTMRSAEVLVRLPGAMALSRSEQEQVDVGKDAASK